MSDFNSRFVKIDRHYRFLPCFIFGPRFSKSFLAEGCRRKVPPLDDDRFDDGWMTTLRRLVLTIH